MLRIVMLFIGVCVIAPVAIVAFLFSLPALPFVLAGFILWKLIQSRRAQRWPVLPPWRDRPVALWQGYPVKRSNAVAPLALGLLAVIMALQIKVAGFSWQLDLGLAVAMLVVAGLWWAQARFESRRLRRSARTGGVAPHDLYQLFEIERATGPEERRVLIIRELNRLTREALRPDPSVPDSWPSIPELVTLRDQVRLLRSSARDTSVLRSTEISQFPRPSTPMLMAGIQALEDYVNLLMRVRLLGQGDLEQMRILVRDQSRLRTMQDEFVGELQSEVSVPVA